MTKPEKNIICQNNNSCVNYQNINNYFIYIYINNCVKKFHNYNNEKFLFIIGGLKKFINEDDKILTYLLEQLKENNFTIEFENEKVINEVEHLDITYKNITTDKSENYKYQIQNLPTILELSSKTVIPVVGIIIMKIIAQKINKLKKLYKAIVLDLDDTLWKGTLSEVGIDKIRENMCSEKGDPFIKFMKFVKILGNELGIFITICSRNDSKLVESTIEKFDENIFPLKNQIDYIIANNNDKSKNIITIAEKLSILPNSIVFIDDNQIVRDEVKDKVPEVFVPEWTDHNELITQLIIGCIFERSELSLNSQNRRKQYKILQTERAKNSLPRLSVKITKDDEHTESIKLYSKSNQFKFSRNDDDFKDAKSLYFEIFREDGENLGICSVITYTLKDNVFHIHNWAISCRFFEIGLEEFILIQVQKIANPNKIFISYQHSNYNQKVHELLAKYPDIFKNDDKSDKLEIIFTKETADKIDNNTNLRSI